MLLMVGVLFCSAPAVFAEQPSVCASSAVLMEAQNGRVQMCIRDRHRAATNLPVCNEIGANLFWE